MRTLRIGWGEKKVMKQGQEKVTDVRRQTLPSLQFCSVPSFDHSPDHGY